MEFVPCRRRQTRLSVVNALGWSQVQDVAVFFSQVLDFPSPGKGLNAMSLCLSVALLNVAQCVAAGQNMENPRCRP